MVKRRAIKLLMPWQRYRVGTVLPDVQANAADVLVRGKRAVYVDDVPIEVPVEEPEPIEEPVAVKKKRRKKKTVDETDVESTDNAE